MRCELLPAQRVLASLPEKTPPTRMLQSLKQGAGNMLLHKHRGPKSLRLTSPRLEGKAKICLTDHSRNQTRSREGWRTPDEDVESWTVAARAVTKECCSMQASKRGKASICRSQTTSGLTDIRNGRTWTSQAPHRVLNMTSTTGVWELGKTETLDSMRRTCIR